MTMTKKLLTIFLFLSFYSVSAGDYWTKVKSVSTTRVFTSSFSLNNKGYFTCGVDQNGSYKSDCWMYDPANDSWAQKASMDSTRGQHVSFTVGKFAYVGTGVCNGSISVSFHKYNDLNNTWSSIKAIPQGVIGAAAFTIGSYGYVCTGELGGGGGVIKKLWQYSPSNDTWTAKADYPGSARKSSCAFTIGTKAFLGHGFDGNSTFYADFYSYSPIANVWTSKASFPNGGVYQAQSFAIFDKGYVVGGYDGSDDQKTTYVYDTLNNSWTQKSDLPGGKFHNGISFEINNQGYAGLGANNGGSSWYSHLYKFNPFGDSIFSSNIPVKKICQLFSDTLQFYAFGVYTTNNQFKIELSDSFGSFNNPVIIGSIADTVYGLHKIPVTINNQAHTGKGYRIRVISTNPSLVSKISSDSFEIGQKPIANCIIFKDTACSKDTIILSSQNTSGTYIYAWFKNGVLQNNSSSTYTVDSTGKYSLLISPQNSSCISDTFSKNIVINPTPVSILLSTKDSLCPNDSALLTSQKTDTTWEYQWFENAIQVGSSAQSYTAMNGGDFNLVIKSKLSNCISDTLSKSISILQAPTSIINSSKDTSCSVDSIILVSQFTSPNWSYSWAKNGNPINGASSEQYITQTSGSYKLKTTSNINGCVALSSSKEITVFPTPDNGIFIGKDTICESDSVLLKATKTANGNIYEWLVDGKSILNSNTFQIYGFESGNYKFKVQSSEGCNAESKEKTLVVGSRPVSTISAQNDSICSKDSMVLLSNQINSGYIYSWYRNKVLLTETDDFYKAKSSGNYLLIIRNQFNCSATSNPFKLTVIASPATPTITYSNHTLTSSANVGNQWYFEGQPIANASQKGYTVANKGRYTVMVTGEFGCSESSAEFNYNNIGANELSHSDGSLEVFPNPANEKINVVVPESESPFTKISLINMNGQIVYSKLVSNSNIVVEIPTNEYPAGIYFVSLVQANETITKKIAILRN
jgi:hypothetical protein